MKEYKIQKLDDNLYIKGFSGALVYSALYGIVAAMLVFVALYIFAGAFTAVLICVPGVFAWLYRVKRIQRKYGHSGWAKKRFAGKLPQFIIVKTRICQSKEV